MTWQSTATIAAYTCATLSAITILGFVAWAIQSLADRHPLDGDMRKNGFLLWLLDIPPVLLMEVYTKWPITTAACLLLIHLFIGVTIDAAIAGWLSCFFILSLALFLVGEHIDERRDKIAKLRKSA